VYKAERVMNEKVVPQWEGNSGLRVFSGNILVCGSESNRGMRALELHQGLYETGKNKEKLREDAWGVHDGKKREKSKAGQAAKQTAGQKRTTGGQSPRKLEISAHMNKAVVPPAKNTQKGRLILRFNRGCGKTGERKP